MSNLAKPPQTLARILLDVKEQFATALLSTSVLVGDIHLADNDTPDRIVFIPTDGDPAMAPIRLSEGGSAKLAMGCDAYVWGVETDDDYARYDAADLILANMTVALDIAAPGRIVLLKVSRDKATRVVTYGEEYVVTFSYLFQINRATGLVPLPPTSTINIAPAAIPEL